MSKAIEDIVNEINKCEKCELCKSRINTVPGDGGLNSRIMFIGEAPGQTEDETGKPFVGRSGKLLDKLFDSVGINREKDIYITNILKCRPPKNRDPKPDEQEICINYLREQYKILRPKIVVCLGRIAAQKIIKPNFAITREHGTWTVKCNTYFTATFHPSALLRNPSNMQLALDDFKEIRKKVLEITNHKI
ncbi:uracil-DNA glycosylase [Clostridium sp. BJN0001]|uniref:uracil-DNA glycosylase n=1 Tax=Clostridium sp. BJN0001 TaxID=2930219 RepID=UPI001FD252C4|nr:uracil-DNA glycosylase [Clostridium sp. BJN0001]